MLWVIAMNPELQKELLTWLSSMREAAQGGINFALTQAPLVVQEKVLYGRITATAWLVFSLGVLLFGSYWTRRVWTWIWAESKKRDFDGGEVFASVAVTATCVIAPLGFVCSCFDEAVKLWFAPRLYIVEWLSGLLK